MWLAQGQRHMDQVCQCASAGQYDTDTVWGSVCQDNSEDVWDCEAEGMCDQNHWGCDGIFVYDSVAEGDSVIGWRYNNVILCVVEGVTAWLCLTLLWLCLGDCDWRWDKVAMCVAVIDGVTVTLCDSECVCWYEPRGCDSPPTPGCTGSPDTLKHSYTVTSSACCPIQPCRYTFVLEQKVLWHGTGSPTLGMHVGLRQKDLEIWHQGGHGLACLPHTTWVWGVTSRCGGHRGGQVSYGLGDSSLSPGIWLSGPWDLAMDVVQSAYSPNIHSLGRLGSGAYRDSIQEPGPGFRGGQGGSPAGCKWNISPAPSLCPLWLYWHLSLGFIHSFLMYLCNTKLLNKE